jgi:hypothetical protein
MIKPIANQALAASSLSRDRNRHKNMFGRLKDWRVYDRSDLIFWL